MTSASTGMGWRLGRLVGVTVAEDGLGKRTSIYEYRITARGGKGVELMGLDRGKQRVPAVAAFPIQEDDQLMIVSDGGQVIRTPVRDVRIAGRSTRGVWICRVAEGEKIVSVARIEDEGEEDEVSAIEDSTEA